MEYISKTVTLKNGKTDEAGFPVFQGDGFADVLHIALRGYHPLPEVLRYGHRDSAAARNPDRRQSCRIRAGRAGGCVPIGAVLVAEVPGPGAVDLEPQLFVEPHGRRVAGDDLQLRLLVADRLPPGHRRREPLPPAGAGGADPHRGGRGPVHPQEERGCI